MAWAWKLLLLSLCLLAHALPSLHSVVHRPSADILIGLQRRQARRQPVSSPVTQRPRRMLWNDETPPELRPPRSAATFAIRQDQYLKQRLQQEAAK
eukprot:scaffold29528_cov32-Tisochrysis_lutea.AAC.2